MDQAAVPAVFNYQPIPAAVGGYYSQAKQPPSNGTSFQAGQWIQLPIVTGRIGQFYDPQRCYFMFRVLMGSAQGLMLERVGAHAFFESVELWLNGQPLEQIQQYNCLMQLIRDQYYGLGRSDVCAEVEGCAVENMIGVSMTTANAGYPSGAMVMPQGTAGVAIDTATDLVVVLGQQTLSTNSTAPADATIVPGVLANVSGGPNALIPGNGGTANSTWRWFAVPILSGLLGTPASKAFPALVFAPGSLFWQIKLAQSAAPGTRFVPTAVANQRYALTLTPFLATDYWTVDNFNFVSGAVTLQSGVAATILSAAASGQLDLNTKSFTNVFVSIPASQTAANLIVPLRKLSLNSIFVTFRDPNRETGSGASTNVLSPSYGGFLSRIAPTGCLNETFTAQWRFGNELIREYPYQQHVEFYVEVLRNLHEWFDKELNFCTALRPIRALAPLTTADTYVLGQSAALFHPVGGFYATYADAGGGTPTATAIAWTCDKPTQLLQQCGFFLALDLDVFSGSSSTSRSGRNTTGDQITVNLTNGAATSGLFGARNMRADFFGMHDLRVNIQAGGIAVPVS
jgi:hypothetical protein